MKRALGQRQIPTLLGLGILIASLVGGIALIGTGGGVFAPRATPQTTPKNLKITNIKDTSFTVSFITDEATSSFIKYGKSPTEIKSQAADDRDQLNGNIGQFNSHYITVRDLDPDTQYYFIVGTASVPRFDNNGEPFSTKTAKKNGNPTAAKTAYGSVNSANGSPADGAIVYLAIPGASDLSALVKSSGSWAIPLSNARNQALTAYATVQPTDLASIFVQGTKMSDTTTAQYKVSEIQPAQTLVLAAGSVSPQTDTQTVAQSPVIQPDIALQQNAAADNQSTSLTQVATESSLPTVATLTGSDDATVAAATAQVADTVDLKIPEKQTVETSKPTITGKAAPNTLITVEIHSDAQITTQVKTDENGDFVLPLSGGQTSLEPGEHTVTISYTDPTTGQTKSVIRTFTVAASGTDGNTGTLLALSNSSPVPYGTENPYTISSPTPSPVTTDTATISASASPRISMPSTSSNLPRSGSTDTTVALIIGGCFLIGIGVWSYKNHTLQALIETELADESI